MPPKYPGIHASLIGENGNALNLISIVAEELRLNNIDRSEIKEFQDQALSGDYNNVLTTCNRWVAVE